MSMTPRSDEDFWTVTFPKWAAMDVTLMSELDRLATYYDMNADDCLQQLMVLRAEREGTEAVRMMVETATDLWENFKPGAAQGRYWAMQRAQRVIKEDGADA